MRVLFLILLILSLNKLYANDSVEIKKQRKLSIEPGFHSIFFLSNKVKNDFENELLFYTGITNLQLGYKFNNNYKTFMSFSWYYSRFENKKNVKGEMFDIFSHQISSGLQKKIIDKGKFEIFGKLSLNYRFGRERMFIAFNNESHVDNSIYNSFGVGLSNGLDYRIGKRISLGIEIGYFHFFEKSRLDYSEDYSDHKPVRNIIISNFKIGFLL